MSVPDTNVATELMHPVPAPTVAAWIAEQDARCLFLTTFSEAELLYGVAITPTGQRHDTLEASMTRWLELGFGDRILPFDNAAARAHATSGRRSAGWFIGEADCQIAAISRSRGTVLVARTVRDFKGPGVDAVDPWTAA